MEAIGDDASAILLMQLVRHKRIQRQVVHELGVALGVSGSVGALFWTALSSVACTKSNKLPHNMYVRIATHTHAHNLHRHTHTHAHPQALASSIWIVSSILTSNSLPSSNGGGTGFSINRDVIGPFGCGNVWEEM